MDTRVVALVVAMGSVGCTPLSALGPASICTTEIPEMQAAAVRAVAYWNMAGLLGLQPCAPGSIEVHTDPTLEKRMDRVGNTHHGVGLPAITMDSKAVESLKAGGEYDEAVIACLLAHELGHAMGLNHTDRTDSIMFPSCGTIPDEPSHYDVALAKSLL